MAWLSTYLRGYIRRAVSIPGVYDSMAARQVSNTRPKLSIQFLGKEIYFKEKFIHLVS